MRILNNLPVTDRLMETSTDQKCHRIQENLCLANLEKNFNLFTKLIFYCSFFSKLRKQQKWAHWDDVIEKSLWKGNLLLVPDKYFQFSSKWNYNSFPVIQMYKGNTVICKDPLVNEHAKQIIEAKKEPLYITGPFRSSTSQSNSFETCGAARYSLGLISTWYSVSCQACMEQINLSSRNKSLQYISHERLL